MLLLWTGSRSLSDLQLLVAVRDGGLIIDPLANVFIIPLCSRVVSLPPGLPRSSAPTAAGGALAGQC
jgi:hypothetical protein